ncbi:Hypothetical predicted protein, partial [Mytilus galloprovincialis]
FNASIYGNRPTRVLTPREKGEGHILTWFQMSSGPTGSVYTQWGRKTCTRNGTELVYSGLGGGGFYNNRGRSATPVCVPHDPDLGPVSSTGLFSTMYGMEYNDAAFGNNLYDKDVPCAVCMAIHRTSIMMVPGKLSCYKGWTTEYQGILASGHHADAGASSYICVDHSPEVLEGGVQDENGYTLFPVKAYCGSLKCPPYVKDHQRTGCEIRVQKLHSKSILGYYLKKILHAYFVHMTKIIISLGPYISTHSWARHDEKHHGKYRKMCLTSRKYLIKDMAHVATLTSRKGQSSVYTQWGRKTCTRNGTELVYTGLGGGGFMGNKGRSATPVCVPHDPDLGPISSKNGYSTMYGMEYNDAVFGNNNIDKDVPCAVCLAIHRTSIMMVPGKLNCYKGWTTEYQGILASGHHADPGASSYICVDHSPEVLEGGVQNENGYTLFPVKAYCGSLKCPPYVQNIHLIKLLSSNYKIGDRKRDVWHIWNVNDRNIAKMLNSEKLINKFNIFTININVNIIYFSKFKFLDYKYYNQEIYRDIQGLKSNIQEMKQIIFVSLTLRIKAKRASGVLNYDPGTMCVRRISSVFMKATVTCHKHNLSPSFCLNHGDQTMSTCIAPTGSSCYKGWNMEYKGILVSGHHDDVTYIIIKFNPAPLYVSDMKLFLSMLGGCHLLAFRRVTIYKHQRCSFQ